MVDLYYSLPKRGRGKGVPGDHQLCLLCAKPHTPFEFVPMDTEEMLCAKQKHLLESVRSRKIKVNYHDSTTSFLEACSPGDRRLAPVIVEAYKRGCYFDGWEGTSSTILGCRPLLIWASTRHLLSAPIGLDEVTPWSHMDYGVTTNIWYGSTKAPPRLPALQPCSRLRCKSPVRRSLL